MTDMSNQERTEGSTPNGGAYAIAYWKDGKGSPTTKDKAVAAEIIEYSATDEQIFRSYVNLNNQGLQASAQ